MVVCWVVLCAVAVPVNTWRSCQPGDGWVVMVGVGVGWVGVGVSCPGVGVSITTVTSGFTEAWLALLLPA